MPHASHAMALQCSGFTFNFRVPPLRWDVLRVSLLELSLELLELLELELRLVSSGFRVGNLLEEAASFDALFRVGNIFEEAASFGALRSLMELADHDATSAVAEKS